MNRPEIPDSSPRHEARSDPQGLPQPGPAQQPGSVQRTAQRAAARDRSGAPAAVSEFAVPAANWLG